MFRGIKHKIPYCGWHNSRETGFAQPFIVIPYNKWAMYDQESNFKFILGYLISLYITYRNPNVFKLPGRK